MLFRFLDYLRTKPKPARQQYAFMIALLFTGSIMAVWAVSLPARFQSIGVVAVDDVGTAPFAGLWEGLKNGVASFRQTAAVVESEAASTTAATTTMTSSGTSTPVLPVMTGVTTSNKATTTVPPGAARPVLIATTSTTTR